MADHRVIGKEGVVTGRVAPGTVGEVLVPVRGSSEAFLAHPPGRMRVCGVVRWLRSLHSLHHRLLADVPPGRQMLRTE